MLVNGKHYRTVWVDNGEVRMIEQNRLPFSFEVFQAKSLEETCRAIRDMVVRGAGAIGATAGFAMAQHFLNPSGRTAEEAADMVRGTRPTAQNLFYAVDRVCRAAENSSQPQKAALEASQAIADEDAEACRLIGMHAGSLVAGRPRVMTHCNAGWLAFVDWGSALSPVYMAVRDGAKPFVYVSETGPRGQGARLTAWELQQERVEHAVIADNASGFFLNKGEVDVIITGADRIARNGDTANKIGTYMKAVLAKELGIPFYIAAPTSTIDFRCGSATDIPIEFRGEEEVLWKAGVNEEGVPGKILVAAPGSHAKNPAFDVTPAKYITGIITEMGIFKPGEIAGLK
ncbi:MAG: S-methyl-5-thioribose-1-phosphate isomerase [Candidatus Aenigmarchaeota archaeon]|nr:S-methyl-5-thioribose-1-phosphate isomerase [Candidatus Aenigmarchaeota archaeon]